MSIGAVKQPRFYYAEYLSFNSDDFSSKSIRKKHKMEAKETKFGQMSIVRAVKKYSLCEGASAGSSCASESSSVFSSRMCSVAFVFACLSVDADEALPSPRFASIPHWCPSLHRSRSVSSFPFSSRPRLVDAVRLSLFPCSLFLAQGVL